MSTVVLKIQQDSYASIPEFSDCLVSKLEPYTDSFRVPVSFSLDNGVLLLRRRPIGYEDTEPSTFLQHSVACPLQVLSESKQVLDVETRKRDIAIAVSVIVEASDNYVLLTKRASHMRASPGVWVPPGGHLEKEESLLECGLREIKEETGLNLKDGIVSLKTLCLWENVFPLSVTFGTPKYHSLVIYFHIVCRQNHEDLIKQMRIDPSEVAAFAWLSASVISELFKPGEKECQQQDQYIWENNTIARRELKYLDMFNRFIWTSNSVYSGVQCSLLEWYNDYKSRRLVTKL